MPQLLLESRAVTAGLAISSSPAAAKAVDDTQMISGNGWVALGVIGLLVAIIYFVIRGTMYIENRHARMRDWRHDDHHHGWFGLYDDDGDDDAPN